MRSDLDYKEGRGDYYRAEGLREIAARAQAAQPPEFRPESGYDLDAAAEGWQLAKNAERATAATLAAEVRNAVSAGMSVREAARRARVPRTTAYAWLAQHD